MSWPAGIDVFLAIGELALYVAYLDGWPARQQIWPWTTALTGLAVSIAGNIGHIQAAPGQPVILADRVAAATSPIAAFAGLTVGLLVLKMTRQQAAGSGPRAAAAPARQHWPQAAVSPPPGPHAGTVLDGGTAGRAPARTISCRRRQFTAGTAWPGQQRARAAPAARRDRPLPGGRRERRAAQPADARQPAPPSRAPLLQSASPRHCGQHRPHLTQSSMIAATILRSRCPCRRQTVTHPREGR